MLIWRTFRFFWPENPSAIRRHLVWFLFGPGLIVLGAGLLRDATLGGAYPWSPGKVYWGVMAFWLGLIVFRGRVARVLRKSEMAKGAFGAFIGRWSDRLIVLTLMYIPACILGWYSIEAANVPSRNSRGRDVCDTSAAQFCVSGPRALIPWAILLFVTGTVAAVVYIKRWGATRRDPPDPSFRPNTTFTPEPPPTAGVSGPAVEAPGRAADPDLDPSLKRLEELVRMRQAGYLTQIEFEKLKTEVIREATDGTAS